MVWPPNQAQWIARSVRELQAWFLASVLQRSRILHQPARQLLAPTVLLLPATVHSGDATRKLHAGSAFLQLHLYAGACSRHAGAVAGWEPANLRSVEDSRASGIAMVFALPLGLGNSLLVNVLLLRISSI